MTKSYSQPLLDAANAAYEMGELRLNEALPRGERGDGLADFIASEIAEVVEGSSDFESARQTATNAMETAIRQLQEVIAGLEGAEASVASE